MEKIQITVILTIKRVVDYINIILYSPDKIIKMKTKKGIRITLLLTFVVLFFSYTLYAQQKKESLPNVIVVLADDLGPGDLSAYDDLDSLGCKCRVPTPALDRLAASGMLFTRAHSSSALCAPTRACILTGRHTRNVRAVWSMGSSVFKGGKKSLGDVMKAAGYYTGFIGKQHAGGTFWQRNSDKLLSKSEEWKWENIDNVDFERPIKDGLHEHGFDYSLGLIQGMQAPPFFFIHNGLPVQMDEKTSQISPIRNATCKKQLRRWISGPHKDGKVWINIPGWGSTEWNTMLLPQQMCQHAIGFLDEVMSQHAQKPFFLYYCALPVHVPHVPAKELSVTFPDTKNPKTLTFTIDGYDGSGPTKDDIGTKQMRMVNTLDCEVATLLDYLDCTPDPRNPGKNLIENTMIIFTSDNGGLRWGSGRATPPEWTIYRHDPTSGLRDCKGSIWEGGHRVPFIVSWPGHVPKGMKSRQLIGTHDIMSSLMALTKTQISGAGPDSYNMLPVFLGQQGDDKPIRPYLLVGYEGGHSSIHGDAYFEGDWKLVVNKHREVIGLYNLVIDPREEFDQAHGFKVRNGLLPEMYQRYAILRKFKHTDSEK